MTADLDLKRDSENFYDTPASVYNIKKKFQDHQIILKINISLKRLWYGYIFRKYSNNIKIGYY